MKIKTTGIQHVGIPTNDIQQSIAFYTSLGFEIALQTVNEKANEKVVFLQLGNLVFEVYENKKAIMLTGAIDHIALDVTDIDELYKYIKGAGYEILNEQIDYLPFWENGVKFFTIVGPNKEKIEFCEKLK